MLKSNGNWAELVPFHPFDPVKFSEQTSDKCCLYREPVLSEKFVPEPQLDDIQSPALRDFFGIWLELHDNGGPPKSKNFPLTVFEQHLPYVIQIDCDQANDHYLIKYFGSGYAEGIGQDFTNKFMNDVPETKPLLARSRWLVANKQSYLVQNVKIVWSPKNYRRCSAIACPLVDDAGHVSGIVYRVEFDRSAK